MIILETNRLILRQFHIFDGEAMDLVFGDPEVMRFGPGVQTQKWVGDWIQGCLESYQRLGFGPWAVVKRSSSSVIGYSGLFHFPDIAGHPKLRPVIVWRGLFGVKDMPPRQYWPSRSMPLAFSAGPA
jgi:[ribosomal protein S5]-alanine N-acetyltransferase